MAIEALRARSWSGSIGRGLDLMAEYTSLEKIRLKKTEELRALGVDPYPTRASRTHTSAEAIKASMSNTSCWG